jgi:hypothetical protein
MNYPLDRALSLPKEQSRDLGIGSRTYHHDSVLNSKLSNS